MARTIVKQVAQAAPVPNRPPAGGVTYTGSAPTNESRSLSGFIGNVFKSGGRFARDTVMGAANVLNPDPNKNTAINIGRLGLGAIEKVVPGEQGHEDNFDALTGYFKDRYGGVENVKKTLYEDPVGFASDVSLFLSAGGAGLKLAGKGAKLAGAVKTAEKASELGSKALQLGAEVNPIAAGTKAVKTLGGAAIRKTGLDVIAKNAVDKFRTMRSPSTESIADKLGMSDDPQTLYALNPSKQGGSITPAEQQEILKDYVRAHRIAHESIKNPTAKSALEHVVKEEIADAVDNIIKHKGAVGKGKEVLIEAHAKAPLAVDAKGVLADFYKTIEKRARTFLSFDEETQKFSFDSLDRVPKVADAGELKKLMDFRNRMELFAKNPSVREFDNLKAGAAELTKVAQKNGSFVKSNTLVDTIISETIKKLEKPMQDASHVAKANSEYSRLSRITDAAKRLLGKKSIEGGTISGASVAKRAVKSLADGGSKEFIRVLEEETGRPIGRKIITAIKAMEDAGDRSGLSILKDTKRLVGEIPTSQTGLLKRAGEKGIEAMLGDSTERTLRYMRRGSNVKKIRSYPRAAKAKGYASKGVKYAPAVATSEKTKKK